MEQAARETEAYNHTLERHNVKSNHEKQALLQKMELLTRDFTLLMERTEQTENILERVNEGAVRLLLTLPPTRINKQEQNLYETKLTAVKERMKQYKHESEQNKVALEAERSKQDSKKEEVRLSDSLVSDQRQKIQQTHFTTPSCKLCRCAKGSKCSYSILIK